MNDEHDNNGDENCMKKRTCLMTAITINHSHQFNGDDNRGFPPEVVKHICACMLQYPRIVLLNAPQWFLSNI